MFTFCMQINSDDDDPDFPIVKHGKLSLVDLAGEKRGRLAIPTA